MPIYIENVDDLMNPGKQLVYRIDSKEKRHWTLYSIGQNLVDDGGKVEWDNSFYQRSIEEGDWVWSVPMVRKPVTPAAPTKVRPKPKSVKKVKPKEKARKQPWNN